MVVGHGGRLLCQHLEHVFLTPADAAWAMRTRAGVPGKCGLPRLESVDSPLLSLAKSWSPQLLRRRCRPPPTLFQEVEKRLSRPIPALPADLALPSDIAARSGSGSGDRYGQQRGGGVSQEVQERVQVRHWGWGAWGMLAWGGCRVLVGGGPTSPHPCLHSARTFPPPQAVRPAVAALASLEHQAQVSFFQLKERKWGQEGGEKVQEGEKAMQKKRKWEHAGEKEQEIDEERG